MMTNHQMHSILTSWGAIKVEIAPEGVVRCRIPYLREIPKEPFSVVECGSDPYSCYVRSLFEGARPALPPVGMLGGTPFQTTVWKGLMAIPGGETRTYRELADQIGCARSVRAVANACGRNPAPLFVPCHRVIRTDGNPGGFSGGLAWKRLLLAAEQSNR